MQFGGDTRTRHRVMHAVSTRGPVTAGDLATEVGLTAAGVRRHLDAMVTDGLVVERELAGTARRGRGRPARAFVLTPQGHTVLDRTAPDGGRDDLALSAIEYLAATQGRGAVAAFALHRSTELERRYAPQVDAAGGDPADRAEALAAALSVDGYAATTRPVGGTGVSAVQLCQGHCPVRDVAARYPELCEAEAHAFSRLLGTHVRRLATQAHGAHVCTTHVSVGTSTGSSTRTTHAAAHDTTSGRALSP